jgi:hypothetical protein
MTTFNTGNSVPSSDGRDLSDNAKSLDSILNGNAPSVLTRTGKSVATIDNLEKSYLFTAINGGVWAAGQSFTALNQYMVFSGTAYKPKNSTTLPYVIGATPDTAFVEITGNLSESQANSIYTQIRTLTEAVSSVTAQEFDYVIISDRALGRFQYLSGQIDNTYTIISAANSLSLVWVATVPIIAEQVGIRQAAADNSAAMLFAEQLAISMTSKIELTIKGTYRSLDDRELSLYTGIGFIVITGFAIENTFQEANQNATKPVQIEKGSGTHVGGEGRYTAFFGGATFQGSKVFFARNGADHISSPTKVARYIVDENGAVTKGVLKDTLGFDMSFVDFRDSNLGLQRSLTQGPVLSGSEKLSLGVYQHYFMKLDVGDFNVNAVYSVSGIPTDEFMWGNAVHTRDEFWLKCTYGTIGGNLHKVHIYRATGNGADPVSWVKIKDSLFTDASECTLSYWEDRLVAITRSEPQSNAMKMRWTYDLEGADGWSDVVNLPFTGAAPSMIPYIPKGDPIVLHISVLDVSSGYRVPIITSTPNLEDWTNISSGQFKNFTGSGAYGALVSSRNGYSMMYYEEVGAVDMQTRVWYVDVDIQTRVYPNNDLVDHIANIGLTPSESCVLPSGKACLGDIGSTSRFFTSSSDGSYLEIVPKREITISAFASIMSAPAPVSTTVTLTGGALNIVSSSTSISSTTPVVFEFPLVATLLIGVKYRFTFNVNAGLHGRATARSKFKPISENYANYQYVLTNIQGSSFNEFVISHGLVY